MAQFIRLTQINPIGKVLPMTISKAQVAFACPASMEVNGEGFTKKKVHGTKVVLIYNSYRSDFFVREVYEDVEKMLND